MPKMYNRGLISIFFLSMIIFMTAAFSSVYAENQIEDFYKKLYVYQSTVIEFPQKTTENSVTAGDIGFSCVTISIQEEEEYSFKIGLFRKISTATGVVEYKFEQLEEIDYNYAVSFKELVPDSEYTVQVCGYTGAEIAAVYEAVSFQTKPYSEEDDDYAQLSEDTRSSEGCGGILSFPAGITAFVAAGTAAFLLTRGKKRGHRS